MSIPAFSILCAARSRATQYHRKKEEPCRPFQKARDTMQPRGFGIDFQRFPWKSHLYHAVRPFKPQFEPPHYFPAGRPRGVCGRCHI